MAIETFFRYKHVESSEDTVGKFFDRNSPLTDGLTALEFLTYYGDTDTSNAGRIYNSMDSFQKGEWVDNIVRIIRSKVGIVSEDECRAIPLPMNTELLIPKGNFKSETVSIKGKNLFLEESDLGLFMSDKLEQILSDPNYVKSENIVQSGRDLSVEIINENVQIWIWSRALDKIINVSPFVQRLNISKGEGVGSFSFQLSPVDNLNDMYFVDDKDFLNYFTIDNERGYNLDFFYKNLQYNDVAFLRMEKLKMEEDFYDSFENSFTVDPSSLPGNVWDMIGLLDDVQQSTFFKSDDYVLNVSGRDLTKLLTEDGSYFLSIRYLNNGEASYLPGLNREDKWFKRNIADKSGQGGFISYNFPFTVRKISDTLGFVINQLSNLGVVGSNLFSHYKERRTKYYGVSGHKEEDLKVNEVNGIWQIIKLFYDKKLDGRRVMDPSIAYVDSNILSQFNKVCEKPFVEFFGDTYGDEYNFVVRQPPFTKQAIVDFIYRIQSTKKKSGYYENVGSTSEEFIVNLEEKDIEGYGNLKWDNTYYSWYQLSPKNEMLGKYSELMTGGFVPIVYFDKIAQMFGNKRFVIKDNYLPVGVTAASESSEDNNVYKEAMLHDLKYVIDIHSYLPFTRRGTLILSKGDRRIKRGSFIRVKPTNEIFYVESVSNDVSFGNSGVDRVTKIEVSRGMLEDYILGTTGYDDDGKVIKLNDSKYKTFSYFDIIRTEVKDGKFLHKFDEEQFDFFMKRWQFNFPRL